VGFLSRLFDNPPQKGEQGVPLDGLGKFSVQVVGESYYQKNLSKICGGFTKDGVEHITTAKLVHDDDNQYDNKAVRVEVSGMPVGHLNKSEARYFRNQMLANGHAGMPATCKAKITGGWDRGRGDIGYFGVALDLPTEFVEPPSNSTSITNDSEQTVETDIISFYVEKTSAEELAQCQIGDYVNLWVPKDASHKVYVFRRGSIGGTGRIGYVESKHSRIIATHLSKGLKYETEIVEINAAKLLCKIKCRLISQEETKAKQAAEAEVAASRLRTELQKRYTPKSPLLISVELPKNHKLKEGQELYLEKQPLEYYIQNALKLHINFVDKKGIVVAQKTNEPQLIRSILRAFFSQCAMKFQITSIEKPDKYALNYLERIESKVEVSFDKDA
jgi:hypothetical protein